MLIENIKGMPKPEGYDNPYERVYAERGQFWPVPGDKVRYKGSHMFWFTSMIKDSDELLEVGKEYTIRTLAVASSWCGITLEEITKDEEYPKFPLSFFTYERIPDVPISPALNAEMYEELFFGKKPVDNG